MSSSTREFFSLREIAQTAKRENWPTGKALEESRKLLRRKRSVGPRARARRRWRDL